MKNLLFTAIIIFLLFTCTKNVKAQKEGQPLADSLEQVLGRKDISETDRVDVLAKLAFEYRNLLPRKAIAYGERAEKLAKEIHYENKLGEIYLYQAMAYAFFNDISKSYEFALMGLKFNTDYQMADLIPFSKLLVLNFNPNITKEVIGNSLHKILPEANNVKDKVWYIYTIGLLGNGFKNIGENREADSLINLAMEESQKNNQKFSEMHNLARIGGAYFKKKNYDTAIYLLKKVKTYFESIGEKRISSENLGILADIYLTKSENDPKSIYLDSAQICADLSLQKCLEIEYQTQLLNCYNLNYSINKKKGNSKKAMDYLEKYVSINDSLYGNNARNKIVGIAIKQRDEIADAQLKLKDAQVLRQRIYSYAALAGIGLTALLLFFVYRNSKNQKKSTAIIIKEKQRSEELLLNILPSEMVEELKANGTTKAKAFTMVTVMFTDFKDFTTVSEKVSAELLVAEIHHCFSTFDRIIQKYKIEKIKTIGDSYMCASGLPVSNYTHAKDMVNAAFEIRNFMLERKKEKEANDEIPFELRIGIHTGPVVAGIVGIKKFAYDIWGDTVNLAARMEQNCDAGKINISGSTYELVKEKFKCEHRGKIQAKNKGEIDMYFVEEIHSMVRSSDNTGLAKVDSSVVN